MDRVIGMLGTNPVIIGLAAVLIAMALLALAGASPLALALAGAVGMAFTGAVQQNPNVPKNDSSFYIASTLGIVGGRVQSGELMQVHADLISKVGETVLAVTDEFLRFVPVAQARYTAAVAMRELTKTGEAALATLQALALEVAQLEARAQALRNGVWPSVMYVISPDNRASVPPAVLGTLNRVLDWLQKLDGVIAIRRSLTESAQLDPPDDEPVMAVREIAPAVFRRQILDERTVSKLQEIYLARNPGVKAEVESITMAAWLSRHLLEKGRGVIRGIIGGADDEDQPLQAGSGRRVPRRR
jgi:hypothetical protein